MCESSVLPQAASGPIPNLEFRIGDAVKIASETPSDSGGFDVVFAFDVIHDLSNPAGALAEIRRALKPDGVFVMVDIRAGSGLRANVGHPMAPFLYTVSLLHCMPQGLQDDGAGLGTTIPCNPAPSAAGGKHQLVGEEYVRLRKYIYVPL